MPSCQNREKIMTSQLCAGTRCWPRAPTDQSVILLPSQGDSHFKAQSTTRRKCVIIAIATHGPWFFLRQKQQHLNPSRFHPLYPLAIGWMIEWLLVRHNSFFTKLVSRRRLADVSARSVAKNLGRCRYTRGESNTNDNNNGCTMDILTHRDTIPTVNVRDIIKNLSGQQVIGDGVVSSTPPPPPALLPMKRFADEAIFKTDSMPNQSRFLGSRATSAIGLGGGQEAGQVGRMLVGFSEGTSYLRPFLRQILPRIFFWLREVRHVFRASSIDQTQSYRVSRMSSTDFPSFNGTECSEALDCVGRIVRGEKTR